MEKSFDKSATTILKDNISWHVPTPSANTAPWGLEGIYLALKILKMLDTKIFF